jgi:hypothetical protein
MQWGSATVVPVIDICEVFGKDTGSSLMSIHQGPEHRTLAVVITVTGIRTMVKRT